MSYNEKLIKTALKLAEKGRGLVSPNPMVGAVISKKGRILGTGYHKAWNSFHAEVEALHKAKGKTKGASLYINLEPCCHYGKTPPCVKSLISAGIKEVICSMKDPNPIINGRGFEELENNGIRVRVGIMEKEAEELNRAYILNREKKRPYIFLKWAQTLDGKTATSSRDSKWITSQLSRNYVRKIRFEVDAIMVGITTLLNDNPSLDYTYPSFLSSKLKKKKRYHKVILDPELKMPTEGNIWANKDATVLIVTSDTTSHKKISKFENLQNCEIVSLKTENGLFKIEELLKLLFEKDIGILLIEGGSATLTSFWQEKMVDEILLFCSNKILGDNKGLTSISGGNKTKISESINIDIREFKRFEQELMIRGRPCFQE